MIRTLRAAAALIGLTCTALAQAQACVNEAALGRDARDKLVLHADLP